MRLTHFLYFASACTPLFSHLEIMFTSCIVKALLLCAVFAHLYLAMWKSWAHCSSVWLSLNSYTGRLWQWCSKSYYAESSLLQVFGPELRNIFHFSLGNHVSNVSLKIPKENKKTDPNCSHAVNRDDNPSRSILSCSRSHTINA